MQTLFHGTSNKFHQFEKEFLLKGNNRMRFGAGFYLSVRYKRAAHYSCKGGDSTDYYVYTVEIPELTDDNSIKYVHPVSQSIVKRAEEQLGESIPQVATITGDGFRKYIARKLTGKKETAKITPADEMVAADFLVSIDVIFNKVPFIWGKPDEHYDIIVMKPDVMHILKIEQVNLAIDKKTKKLELDESKGKEPKEIPLDSF